MKPIFKEEKEFLEKQLGLELPNDCWRDGKTIYLNADTKTKILTFRIEDKKIIIKLNKLKEVLKEFKSKSIDEEIQENNSRLDELLKESINKTIECIQEYESSNFRVGDSSGKDSLVCMYVFQKAMNKLNKSEYDVDFFNTTNDTADTYKQTKKNIRNVCNHQLQVKLGRNPTKDELDKHYNEKSKEWIHNPNKGWHRWLKEDKNYYLPSIMVRNCCSTYKEDRIKKILDKKADYVLFLGMRKHESTKRSFYDWYLNDAFDYMYKTTGLSKYKLNMPRNWVKFLPIVNWTDKDIWLFILREKLEFNYMYRLGFNRVGCLCCPYATDYVDLLIEHNYPYLWNRWCKIVEINYDTYNVKSRLKWSKEEYVQQGKWKQASSKTQEYITKKPTEERVKIVSEMLGVSTNIAKKYFKQKCSCGKKLNPEEVAMFLKLYGRYENIIDERIYLCKKCLCKDLNITTKEYDEKRIEFRESGCELF